MDKTLVKILAIGGGLVALYIYLQKSGMWDQWFGAGNEFTDPAKLLAYCAANPNGSAIYVDAAGKQTRTCAQWLAANNAPSFESTGTPPPAPTPATLVDRLRAWAVANAILGTDQANVDQWNYGLAELSPGSAPLMHSSVGIDRGVNDVMNAAKFMELRTQAGLSGLAVAPPPMADAGYPQWVQ